MEIGVRCSLLEGWRHAPVPGVHPEPDAGPIGVDGVIGNQNVVHKIRLLPAPLRGQLYGPIHQIEEDVIGNDPVAGLYKGPSPPHVPYNIVQDRKAIAIGGGAGHHIIKDHTVKAFRPGFDFHLHAQHHLASAGYVLVGCASTPEAGNA